jgi:hypothetical protein
VQVKSIQAGKRVTNGYEVCLPEDKGAEQVDKQAIGKTNASVAEMVRRAISKICVKVNFQGIGGNGPSPTARPSWGSPKFRRPTSHFGL